MSDLENSALANGPESRFVVAAVNALLDGDVARARLRLIEGADAAGWNAVAHRLDVAGRALAGELGADIGPLLDEVDLVPEVLDTSIGPRREDTPSVLARWRDPQSGGELSLDQVWPSLAVVAWLVERVGFPAEVVV